MEFNGTFLVTIISFVLFVFVMNKILYEPINNIVAQRREFVDENLRTAEKNHKKANEISAQKEEKLKGARNDARNKYSDSVVDFKNKKNDILKKPHTQPQKQKNQTNQKHKKQTKHPKLGLKGRMTDLANDIVEKMIGYRSEVQGFDNDAVNRILYQG